jgi:hypothetical protein
MSRVSRWWQARIKGASSRPGPNRKATPLVVIEPESPPADLSWQNSILLAPIVDDFLLLVIHPTGNSNQQQPKGSTAMMFSVGTAMIIWFIFDCGDHNGHTCNNAGSVSHLVVSEKIDRTMGGRVGDPLQIYTDRFSGHYEVQSFSADSAIIKIESSPIA